MQCAAHNFFVYTMTSLNFILKIFFGFSLTILQAHGSKKYDMDVESHNLYGEDFSRVLDQFRRSPDYVKILEKKFKNFLAECANYLNQLLYHYNSVVLEERLADYFGVKTDETKMPRRILRRLNFKRQGSQEEEHEEYNGVQVLDNYHLFNSALTVAERNAMKDLGFTLAGDVIHDYIKSLGAVAEEEGFSSTRLDRNGDLVHPERHTVRPLSTGNKALIDEDMTTRLYRKPMTI